MYSSLLIAICRLAKYSRHKNTSEKKIETTVLIFQIIEEIGILKGICYMCVFAIVSDSKYNGIWK